MEVSGYSGVGRMSYRKERRIAKEDGVRRRGEGERERRKGETGGEGKRREGEVKGSDGR